MSGESSRLANNDVSLDGEHSGRRSAPDVASAGQLQRQPLQLKRSHIPLVRPAPRPLACPSAAAAFGAGSRGCWWRQLSELQLQAQLELLPAARRCASAVAATARWPCEMYPLERQAARADAPELVAAGALLRDDGWQICYLISTPASRAAGRLGRLIPGAMIFNTFAQRAPGQLAPAGRRPNDRLGWPPPASSNTTRPGRAAGSRSGTTGAHTETGGGRPVGLVGRTRT
jgi:hypothetical protein